MTKSYAQIKSAIAKLEKEAAALREAETTKVIAQIKESIATFGLTVEHLFGRGAKALKAAAGKALGGSKPVRKGAGVPKYRHPKTGKTWTGFGKAPAWIATARNRDKFLIDASGIVAAPSVDKAVAPVAAVAKKATRKAAAVKKPARAQKPAPAAVAAPEAKAAKPVAKKAAPATKTAAAPKAAKAPKAAAKAAPKARRPRASSNAAAPVSIAAPAETAAAAS